MSPDASASLFPQHPNSLSYPYYFSKLLQRSPKWFLWFLPLLLYNQFSTQQTDWPFKSVNKIMQFPYAKTSHNSTWNKIQVPFYDTWAPEWSGFHLFYHFLPFSLFWSVFSYSPFFIYTGLLCILEYTTSLLTGFFALNVLFTWKCIWSPFFTFQPNYSVLLNTLCKYLCHSFVCKFLSKSEILLFLMCVSLPAKWGQEPCLLGSLFY